MRNIMIVDMQSGCINKNNNWLTQKIELVLKTKMFDNCYFTVCQNDFNSPYTTILRWDGLKNASEQQLVFSDNLLNSLTTKNLVYKNGYAINYDFIKKLKNEKVHEIYLCGTDIDACMLAIAFSLFDNNIKPVFIKELCGTSSNNKNLENYAFTIIKRQFGESAIISVNNL